MVEARGRARSSARRPADAPPAVTVGRGGESVAANGELVPEGFRLTANGTPPDRLEAEASLDLIKGDAGWHIPTIQLTVQASVPGLDDAKFQELAADAKANCPVSKLLAGAAIALTATLAP